MLHWTVICYMCYSIMSQITMYRLLPLIYKKTICVKCNKLKYACIGCGRGTAFQSGLWYQHRGVLRVSWEALKELPLGWREGK